MLVNGPRLLVADEPTSSLDEALREQVLDLMASLVEQRRMGLLLISHDRHVIAHMCDRAAAMHAGKIERVIGRDELSHINPDDIHRNLP